MSTSIEVSDYYGDVLSVEECSDGSVDFTAKDGSTTTFNFEGDETRAIRDFLNTVIGDAPRRSQASAQVDPDDANEAKLRLAADHGLRAKFSYTGEDDFGVGRERRVEPDDVFTDISGRLLVSGVSFDADGEDEGYRQFRLDRINGPVVIR